jgi:N6-L-threonylcarbamoyladenine synthase
VFVTILGIETSCDETSVAIVENGSILLAHSLATSQKLQEKFRGIVPDQAAREQLKYIIPVLDEALREFGVRSQEIDAIAVTVGPGLIGSLLVGVETAKALALAWNKPLVPVNHLIGHIYANWVENFEGDLPHNSPKLPAVVLIVSGGHTDLLYMKGHGQFDYLGGTQDDAAGECLDKCGRLLGLPYPYGPYIEAEASKFRVHSSEFIVKLPRPMVNSKDFNFSFSGLKTAFINQLKNYESGIMNHGPKDELYSSLAYELQEAITDVLVYKTLMAAAKYQPKSIIVAGGVSANKRLREKMSLAMKQFSNLTIDLCIPPIPLCGDNAVYIASCAHFNYHPQALEKIDANPGLNIESAITNNLHGNSQNKSNKG